MIHVIATITAKPGQRDAILAAFADYIPTVHAEPGCIEYGTAVDAPDMGRFQTKLGDDAFLVIEKWQDGAALAAHAAAPAMAAHVARTKDLVLSRVIYMVTPA
jgi:quinol monooxygenase YgiN